MASVTIRNLDDDVVAKLKARAKANNRSLEAELRQLLNNAAHLADRQEFIATARRIRAMTPKRLQTDSTDLIREDRDR